MGGFKDFLNSNTHKKKSEDITTTRKSPVQKGKPRKNNLITYTSEREFDFLKFYMIVEYYYSKVVFKNLRPREMKLLFFLYSEPPFTQLDFNDHCEMLSWNKGRLKQLINKGYIVEYETKTKKHKRVSMTKLYTLSIKCRRNIRAFYDKLMLRYKITEQHTHNPLFRVNSRSYTHKRYAKKIKQMNNGDYLKKKTEDDWDDLNNNKFADFVAEYNTRNYETIITPKELDEELKKK